MHDYAVVPKSALPLGDRIRSARNRLELSQAQVADRVGVDQTTVSRWERGEGEPPRLNEAAALCAVLNLSWCDLDPAAA